MTKYIGIFIVLILGITAIGIVGYHANLLQQQIISDAAYTPSVSHPTPAPRPTYSVGPISFVPLLTPLLGDYAVQYQAADSADLNSPSDLTDATGTTVVAG